MRRTETGPDVNGREPSASGDGDYAPDPRRWRALAVCLVAGFMSLLDVSIVNVALPSIRDGLNASESDLQWVVSGYALAFGLVLVSAGRLGDVRGRRTVFVTALALFTVASAGCGLAPSAGWLDLARVLQGLAGGLLNPQVSGFVQQLFRGDERGKAFGLLGATIGVSTAVGPLAGGALIGAFGVEQGWRWVFFVNVPVGLLAIPVALKLLPAVGVRRKRESLDPVGVLLLGVGVLLVLLPLVEGQTWQGAVKWLLVPAGLLLLAGYALWERAYARRGREPMVDLRLFALRSYALGAAIGLTYFIGFTAIFFILTLYLQSGEGFSALGAGIAVTPFAIGSAVSAGVSGRFVTRLGRPLIAVGLLLVVLGLAATDVLVSSSPGASVGWLIAAPLLVAGLGSGAVISPNITLTLSQVPVDRAGSAGGVLQTAQRIGGAIGIAAVGSVFFSRLAATRGDWTQALTVGLWLCVGGVVVALGLALADIVHGRDQSQTRAGTTRA